MFLECQELGRHIYSSDKQITSRFGWDNMLLKFYLEHNVDEGCSFGERLLLDYEDAPLPEPLQVDLQFALGTSYTL